MRLTSPSGMCFVRKFINLFLPVGERFSTEVSCWVSFSWLFRFSRSLRVVALYPGAVQTMKLAVFAQDVFFSVQAYGQYALKLKAQGSGKYHSAAHEP